MAHHDMAVESSLLNVKVSYKWDPIVKPKLVDELTSLSSNKTIFVLIGMNCLNICSIPLLIRCFRYFGSLHASEQRC
jgi:hypothetical protein